VPSVSPCWRPQSPWPWSACSSSASHSAPSGRRRKKQCSSQRSACSSRWKMPRCSSAAVRRARSPSREPALRRLVRGPRLSPRHAVLICAVTALAFAALILFVRTTRTGKADARGRPGPRARGLLGIPIDRIASWTFAIGSGLAGLAGRLVGAASPSTSRWAASRSSRPSSSWCSAAGHVAVRSSAASFSARGQPHPHVRDVGVQAARGLRPAHPRPGPPTTGLFGQRSARADATAS